MFTALSRPYKECTAEETIAKIRNILESQGLLPKEIFSLNPIQDLYSSRIMLPADKGGFGTNGKGRTKEYCAASAYGEFMERLQNGGCSSFSRPIHDQLYREFGFYYDPREQHLSFDEFLELPQNIRDDLSRYNGPAKEGFIQAYFERLAAHNRPGVIAVPFYCSRSQKDEYLPITLLWATTGTNGMAAGNSYGEAVYQALCEIMERWAAASVFFDQLTPPSIPDAYLKQYPAEYEIIQNIEKGGKWRVTIKDFSTGRKLPAVGVLIENLENNTYRLNVGCDTSFQIALSRALTEIFQGIGNAEIFDDFSIEIPQEIPSYFITNDEDNLNLRYKVFAQFTRDGTGGFPPSLFGETPSYPFDPASFRTRGSYKEEVEQIIEFFHSLDLNVYIRDVSYLGFPSVYVYVPEVSSLGRKSALPMLSKPTYDQIEIDKIEEIIYRFKSNIPEDLLTLETSLQTLPAYESITGILALILEETSPGYKLNVAFLLGITWFKLGKLDEAAKAFFVFQSDCSERTEYYRAMASYVKHLAAGETTDEARAALEAELGQTDDVRQACHDLDNIDAYIKTLPLPECPNCSSCLLKDSCISHKQIGITRTLYTAMKEAWQNSSTT